MSLTPSTRYPTTTRDGWDPFAPYEMQLRNSVHESVTVYKHSLDIELPSRYARNEPAKAMLEDGYVASWRDDRRSDSLHIIEYTDRWELHLDDHNPRYPDRQLLHLIQDAPKIGLAFAAFCLVMAFVVATWATSPSNGPRSLDDMPR